MNREEQLANAQRMMNNARGGVAPEEVKEAPPAPVMTANVSSGPEISVGDFIAAAHRDKYVSIDWPSRGKLVRIKKFTKGELDKISSPLMRKSLSIDVEMAANKDKNKVAKTPTIEVSMEMFSEMEKIMVELGMSYYKDNENRPVINRHYIDTVMEEEEFSELSALIQKVNPNALNAAAKKAEDSEKVKNS